MSILDHFEGTPRPQQVEALLRLEANWSKYDVFVVRCPVATGKSHIAKCLLNWQGRGTLVVPNNVLKSQILGDFSDLVTVNNLATYGGRPRYEAALARLRASPQRCSTYYGYLGQRHAYYQPLLVVDEAHNLVGFLQDKEAVNLWLGGARGHDVPPWVRTAGDLLVWAESADTKAAAKLAAKLRQHPDTYTLTRTQDYLRGRLTDVIKLTPVTPRHNAPILWPSRVKKLVFLSASFHEEDVYDLGLEGRRVLTIDTGSPIPPTNRPIVYDPVGSMGLGSVESTLPALVARLEELLVTHQTRGLVHCTYAVARLLRSSDLGSHSRLLWHTPATRNQVYAQWLADGRPDSVLVGCGFTEGIDLKDDRARWQVVTKLVYPSKAEPAVLKKLQQRPQWYAWSAARDLIQACGRVCRTPDDYGVTYILDRNFSTLYSRSQGLFPPSFRESLKFL